MDKKTSQRIKGVAVCMMVLHHFLIYNIADLSKVYIELGWIFKICVGIYAVLTGYGYFFAKDKSVKYGLKKIWCLLETYWISLFALFLPIAIRGGYQLTGRKLFINLFGLLPNVNWFAWYVFFYVFCMLVLPFVHKILKFKPSVNFGIALVVPYIIEVILHSVPNYENITAIHDLFSCFLYFPCVLVGYLIAKYRLIERLNEMFSPGFMISLVGTIIILMARYFVDSILGFLLDVFYAPMVIYFLYNIFSVVGKNKVKIVELVFSVLGKYSTGIWFFHAVFFSEYLRDVFQPLLTVIKTPVLMYLWCIVLSLLGALAYQRILDGIHIALKKVRGRK